ncbi:MAG TPA: TolC family protein [Fulvivirga sp.]|nr:TolC family protein [Fulvivirga sp.]
MKKKNRRWFIYLTSNFYPLASSFYILTAIFYLLSSVTQAQSLADYQIQAIENNPGLQAKYKEFEAALERVALAKGMPDPTLAVSAFGQMIETRLGPQQAKFTLSQMFPWFGTLKAKGDAAALLAEAEYQEFLDMRNKLNYRVAAAYYPLYELHEWEKAEKENMEILTSYKNIATKKYENGQGTLVDILRVDIMMKEAHTNLLVLDERKKPLRSLFNNVLNVDEKNEVIIADTIKITPQLSAYSLDSIDANHPKLKEFALKEAAMEMQEKAAIKQGMPQLGLGLDYVIIGKRPDIGPGMAAPKGNGKNVLMPMATMSIPIFRGKYRAAKKEAQIMKESYTFMKEETENEIRSDYEEAWFEIEKNKRYLNLYEQQIFQTNQVLTLQLKSYGNEGTDFDEILRTLQQLLQYKKLNATATINYKIEEARLNYITAKNY